MSSWKYDRDYYARMSRAFGRWAAVCFVACLIFIFIFAIESFKGWIWLPAPILFIAGIWLMKLKAAYRRNFHRAPSKL